MELLRSGATRVINEKLAEVAQGLAEIDNLLADKARFQTELADLLAQEKALLSDDSKTEATRVKELLVLGAKRDVKAGSIDIVTQKLGVQTEDAVLSAETAAGFVNAYKDAAIVALHAKIAEAVKGFIRKDDLAHVYFMSQRHSSVKQLMGFECFLFGKQDIVGRQPDIDCARRMRVLFDQFAELVGDGELSVSVPETWM